MRKSGKAVRTAFCLAAWMLVALPAYVSAADKGHEGMHGMQGMKMDDKAYAGKIGPWASEVRVVDMRAHGATKNTHHVAIVVTDPAAKAPITEGKGSVTVTGPDKVRTKSDLMAMQGHFGADVNLPKPGKYAIDVEIESGGKKGNAAFFYTVK